MSLNPAEATRVSLSGEFGGLHVNQGKTVLWQGDQSTFSIQVDPLSVNLEQPEESEGRVTWSLLTGPISTGGVAEKEGKTLSGDWNLSVSNLGWIRPFLPPEVRRDAGVSWRKLGFQTDGTFEVADWTRGAQSALSHRAKVQLSRLELESRGMQLATPRLTLRSSSSGKGPRQKGKVELKLADLEWNGRAYGEDLTMKLSGGISPRQSRGSAHLVVNAPLNTRIELKQDFTPRGKKGVQVESILRVEDLSFFESLLPPPIARSIQFNWKDFALDWSAEGEWKNLLVVKPDFQIELVPNWEQSWSGFHRSRLQIAHVDWEGMGMAVRLPGLTWSADATVRVER